MKEITIEEYNVLKRKLDTVNEKIQRLEVEKSYKTEQLKKILSQYGVKSVSELKKLRDDKYKEAQEVFVKANEYLKDVSEKIAEADNILHSS